MTLLKLRDKKAFNFLYDKYAPCLYGTVLKLVKNEKLANEVLKKAFIKIWNECLTLEFVKYSLFIWMYAITHILAKAELAEAEKELNRFPKLVA